MKEFKLLLLGLEQEKDTENAKPAFIRAFFGDKKNLSKIVEVDGCPVKIDVVQPSGPFKQIPDGEIQNSHGFVICYSVADIGTLVDAVFIGERILRVFDTDEAPMVLVGLPASSNVSVITKESVALVTSKLRCEFFTLKDFANVDHVFFSGVRAIKKQKNIKMENVSQEDLDNQLVEAIKESSPLNEVVALLDMGASPEAKNKKGIGVYDIAFARWEETSKKTDLLREGVALALYGRGARSVKFKNKEPILEELMLERTKQSLSQQAAERQTALELVHSCINEFPEKILRMKWLTRVNLTNNRISVIPPDIDKLIYLKELILEKNQLSSLPITLGYLSELKTLNLKGNFIRELPHTLGLLEKLEVLELAENPLKQPPPGGTATVLTYLKKYTPGAEKVWQAKACFLGPRGSGKTSLKHALLTGKGTKSLSKKGNFILPTQGVEITEGELELPDLEVTNKSVTLDCYDFSGQEVFFSHHHHFLTSRSVFIVCFNMLDSIVKVEFWLKFLQYKLGNVPIVLVATHSDQKAKLNSASLNELDRIPTLYPYISGFCSVSCVNGTNIDELKSIIQSVFPKIPTLNERIPITYLEMGQALKRMRTQTPMLNWDELSQVSKRFQINSESGIQTAVNKLQQLGMILYFPLHNLVVVSPIWLSYILSSISKFTTEEGILMHNTLQTAWKDIPFDQQFYFMDILTKFEVIHSLPPENKDNGLGGTVPISRSFIPTLVPHIPPQNLAQLFPGPPKYTRRHVFKFVPSGLFQHLIINLLKWIDYEVAWQYGISLVHTKGDVKALILLSLNQIPSTTRRPSLTSAVPITPTGSAPSTPTSQHTPPAPFASSDSNNKESVDVIEVRVDGEIEEAAKVFRGINEAIEMLCLKRYHLELVERLNPCSHCIVCGNDHPTTFLMKDCEILASLGNTTIECARIPSVPVTPPAVHRVLEDLKDENSDQPFFRTHLRRRSANTSDSEGEKGDKERDIALKRSDSEVKKTEMKKPSHIPEPRRSLSATPVSDRSLQEKLTDSPTKLATPTKIDDAKKADNKPEARIVEFKLPEAKSEATAIPPVEAKSDADKLAEFAGISSASVAATKRFKHTFRHSKSQFEIFNPPPEEITDGPEHQMVIAKSTKTSTQVEAGVAFNSGRNRRSSEDGEAMQRALANLGITPKVAARLQAARPIDRLPETRPVVPKLADQKPEPPKPTMQKTEPLKLSALKPEPKFPEERARAESVFDLRSESDLLEIKVTNSTGLKKVNSYKQLIIEPPKTSKADSDEKNTALKEMLQKRGAAADKEKEREREREKEKEREREREKEREREREKEKEREKEREKEKEKERKESKRPLGLGWFMGKKKPEPTVEEPPPTSAPSLSPAPSLSVVIPSTTTQPISITPKTPTLDSPGISESVPDSPWRLRTSDGIDEAHNSPSSSPRSVARRGHSPTAAAWSKGASGEPTFRKVPSNLSSSVKTTRQGFFWSNDTLLQHKLNYSDFFYPTPAYTYTNTTPYMPLAERQTPSEGPGAPPGLGQRRLPSRHKLVVERSQSVLVKVPSDPSIRSRMPSVADIMGPPDASIISAPAPAPMIAQVELSQLAPDVVMADLERPDLLVDFSAIHFEESQTHVSAIADFNNGTEGFSKGQVIEIKSKLKEDVDMFTGEFVDAHGNKIEIKFPASVVAKYVPAIARGSYSEIRKATFNGEVIAAKVMDFSNQPLDTTWNSFRKEIWIMSSMSHQNLVAVKAYTITPPCVVMELMPLGDLYSYINKRNADGSLVHPLDMKTKLKLAMDIALGMCYLHSQTPPMIHRDFKSPNILLQVNSSNELTAKISDFGLSVPMYSGALQAPKARERTVANPLWLAPEILREEQYSISSDVYPFGIILWELLVQKHPSIEGLEHTAFISVLEDAIKEGDRPPIPVDCPENYAALIKNCWHGTPKLRPTYPEVVYQLTRLMTEVKVPIPFGLGHMRVKELQLLGKDKVQSLLLLEDLQQVWAGCRSGDIIIYSNGAKLGSVKEHKAKAHPSVVKFLLPNDGLVYSVSKENVTVWAPGENGTQLKGNFGVHPSKNLIISAATIAPNNLMWCSYHDMSLVCWDLKTRQSIVNVEALIKSPSMLGQVQGVFTEGCILNIGDLLWVTSDTKLLIVDKTTCDVLFVGEGHQKRINALIEVENKVWSGGNDGKICIWDKPTRERIGKQQQQLLLHKAGYRVPQYPTREQKLKMEYMANEDDSENAFSLSMKPSLVLERHNGPVHCLMLVKDKVWSAGHDKNLFVWDYKPEAKLCMKIHGKHQARISTMAATSRDRSLWAASFDSTISIWV